MRCLCALERQRRDHLQHQMMPKAKPLPSVELVRELFNYDAETGVMTWKKCLNNRAITGAVAGTLAGKGYLRVKAFGSEYYVHRLAWLYATGRDPGEWQVDHIDGNRLNNSFCNLRLADFSQNGSNRGKQANNSSGYKGVCWSSKRKAWQSQITVNGANYFLGHYETPELAHMAYAKAAAELHGRFARAA